MNKKLLSAFFLFSLTLLYIGRTNAQWASLSGITGNSVYAMAMWNTDLYAGGDFTTPASRIAKLNGTSLTALAAGGGVNNGAVRAMVVYKNELYVAGTFTSVGTPAITANHVAKWNGTSWSVLGSGPNNGTNLSGVYALAVFNDTLYIGGIFNSANGMTSSANVVKWTGTAFVNAGANGLAGSYVFAFTVHNNELYAGGTGYRVTKYIPGNANFGTTVGSIGGDVDALVSYGGSLYASGNFTISGSPNSVGIGRWTGSAWVGVGSGFSTFTNAKCFNVFNGLLYAGGTFTTAGGVNTRGIAKWNGSSWFSAGVSPQLDGDVNAIVSYSSNPTFLLYAGGGFTTPHARAMRYTSIVGVEEIPLSSESVSIYPNPANEKINIHVDAGMKNARVELYNILGEKIFSTALKSNFETVDTRKYARGIYFVKIISEGIGPDSAKVLTQKLIIE